MRRGGRGGLRPRRALLKESPDKDKENQLKKLQDRIKATLKNV